MEPSADRITSHVPRPTLLSIVIPVHNEERSIAGVIESLARAAASKSVDVEFIIVDDGSDDGSRDVVHSLHGLPLSLYTQDQQGSGTARKLGSGMTRGALVLWIDGDGTYSAEDLPALLKAIEGADQVVGVRRRDFGRLRYLRTAVKGLNNLMASCLWGCRIKDLNSGLRLFRREALLEILPDLPRGFSCTSTATLSALNRRHVVRQIPIRYSPRAEECPSKFHPMWDTWRLWCVVGRMFRKRCSSLLTRRGWGRSAVDPVPPALGCDLGGK